MVPISLNQRQRWIRVAKHIALTMSSIASNLDEQEIHAQLNELERLINEAKTTDQSPTKNNAQSKLTIKAEEAKTQSPFNDSPLTQLARVRNLSISILVDNKTIRVPTGTLCSCSSE